MADTSKLEVTIDGKDNLSGELKRIESGVIRFVGAVTAALTALSAVALPVLESARFQKELLEAAKTTDYSKEQIESLKVGLVDLSTQINVSAKDLAKIATMGGQLGIGAKGNVGALLSFSTEVARAVTALDVSAEEAVTSFGKLINIFNIPSDKFRNALSALNQVSNESGATATELFDVVRRIGDLGGAVKLPEAAALSASMVDLGLTAETAGTTITKIFADMRASASEFAAFVGGGMTVERWVGLLQGQGLKALDLFLDRLNSLPTSVAAAAQMQMVGGGRISEAITKLRMQRARAADLEAIADKESLDLQTRKSSMTKEQVADAEKYVARLREQAVQANLVAARAKSANEAYRDGDSALKEQQTVLSGLSAQWQVFLNNTNKVAMGLGDTLLLPLTDALRNASSVLQSANVGEQLANGMRESIELFREGAAVASYFTGSLKSTNIDWGSLLQIGMLKAAASLLKLVAGGLGSLASGALLASPRLAAYSTALFGTTKAAQAMRKEAAESTAKLADGQQRVGGLFNTAATAAANFATKMVTVDSLNQQAAATQARIAQTTNQTTQAQQALAGAYTAVGRRLQTRAALEASVAAAQQRLAAAEAAGNARGVASNTREIARQQAVLNQVAALETRIQRTQAVTTALNSRLAATQTNVAQLSTGAVGMAQAFTTARAAGQGLAVAVAAALSAGGSGAPGFATRIVTALQAARANATAFGASMAGAFTQARGGATGFAGALSGVVGVVSAVGTQLRTALVGGVTASRATLASLSAQMGRVAREAAGMAAAWELATTSMSRNAIRLATAVSLLTRAVGALRNLLFSFVNIAFLAVLLKESLEFLGLWNSVLKAVGAVWEFFGGKTSSLPQWLQTSEQVGAATEKVEAQRVATAALAQEAGKYNEAVGASVTILSDAARSAAKLSFDKKGPEVLKEVTEATNTLLIAEAKRIENQKELVSLEQLRSRQASELAKARAKAEAAEGGSRATYAQSNLDEQQARMDKINATIAERRALEAQLAQDLPRAYNNVTSSIVSVDDALVQYHENQKDGISLVEEYTSAYAALLRAQQAEQTSVEKRPPAARAPGDVGGQKAAADYAAQMLVLRKNTSDAEKVVGTLEQKMYELTPGNLAFRKWVESVKSSAAPEAVEEFGKRTREALARGMSAAKGTAVPKIAQQDLVAAGTTIAVAAELRTMYRTMAEEARANAERAKNAVSNALEDSRKSAKAAEAAMQDLYRAMRNTQQQASNWKGDQRMDADLRKRLSGLDIEYDRQRALTQERYGWNTRLLAQEMFNLDETFRKKREQEQRIVDLRKSQRDAGQQVGEFDKRIADAQRFTQIIEASNKVLADSASTDDQKRKAVQDRADAEIKAKEAAEQASKVLTDLARLPPVGDKFAIDPAKLEALGKAAGALGPAIADAMLKGAPALKDFYTAQATAYDQAANSQTLAINGAKLAIEQWARVSQVSMEEAILKFAEVTARTKDYQKALEDGAAVAQRTRLAPELANDAALKEQAAKMGKAVGEALGPLMATSIPLTVDQEKLKGSVADAMRSIVSGGPKGAKVDASLSDTSLAQMSQDVTDKVKPPISPTVDAAGAKAISDDIARQVRPKITVDVEANYRGGSGIGGLARGGPVGEVQSFASGGKVRGAGTGTSDSILSWLSNGEYVMDATTTSMFGSKFFASLQAAARGGKASALLARLGSMGLPRFATGGYVSSGGSAAVSPLVERAMGGQSATTSARDTVEVNFNLGGKQKVSLFGERQQAAALVRALKTMEAGT